MGRHSRPEDLSADGDSDPAEGDAARTDASHEGAATPEGPATDPDAS